VVGVRPVSTDEQGDLGAGLDGHCQAIQMA
jgi:hypothetical protein